MTGALEETHLVALLCSCLGQAFLCFRDTSVSELGPDQKDPISLMLFEHRDRSCAVNHRQEFVHLTVKVIVVNLLRLFQKKCVLGPSESQKDQF